MQEEFKNHEPGKAHDTSEKVAEHEQAEEAPEKEFSEGEVKKFFGAAATELDSILGLYYPGP